jgi:type II secretory pathway component PulF
MRSKLTIGLVLAISYAWLLYVVTAAHFRAPEFRVLFEGLGGPLPRVSRIFFATYHWWWLVPAVLIVLAVDLLRRPSPQLPYFTALLVIALATAFSMHACMHEAIFQPLTHILQAIG